MASLQSRPGGTGPGSLEAGTGAPGRIEIKGDSAALVERLQDPLRRALADRRRFYAVQVETLGRAGEVLVTITGSRGRLPLIFSPADLEPGDVFRMVSDTIDRFGF